MIRHAYVDAMATSDTDGLKAALADLYVGFPVPYGIDAARAALDAVDAATAADDEDDWPDPGTVLSLFVAPAATAAGIETSVVDVPQVEGYVLVAAMAGGA